MHKFAFVMDQQVGLRTQALNFERVVGDDPHIDGLWIPVTYEQDDSLFHKLAVLPKGVAGTLNGVRQIRAKLGIDTRLDGVLWATWAAKSVPDLVAQRPAYLVMDMTPVQMQAMGEMYGYSRARAQFLGMWKRRMSTWLYRSATHIFPWNNWVASSLMEDYGVPHWKITPISPGVDTTLYRPDSAARPDDGVVRILFVGGDFARKGGDMLARWCETAGVKKKWEVHIVTRDCVGDIPGAIIHHGVQNNSCELVELYRRCDVFALPTHADSYSLVALEAMASGLPVVISRVGGIPEIVNDGRTGYLVDPGDFAAFREALDRLVNNPGLRAEMGIAARKRAVAEFDCRVNIGRILEAMKAGPELAVRPRKRRHAPNPVPAGMLDDDYDDVPAIRGMPALE